MVLWLEATPCREFQQIVYRPRPAYRAVYCCWFAAAEPIDRLITALRHRAKSAVTNCRCVRNLYDNLNSP